MIATFSPFSRKVIAVGLLVMALLLGLSGLVLPLGEAIADDLARLRHVRAEVARLQGIALDSSDTSVAPVPQGMYISAPDLAKAYALFAGDLSVAAARRGVEVHVQPPALSGTQAPSMLSLQFEARGNPDALLLLVNDLERGARLIRFSRMTVGVPPGVPNPAAPSSPMLPPPMSVPSSGGAPTTSPPVISAEAPVPPPASPAGMPQATPAVANMQATALALWGAKP